MKTMRNLLWLSFACLALAACAKTNSSGGSSETHFLALCNATCDDGFSCLCGVCTESCDDDDACEELSGEATCEASPDGCGTPKVCDVGCSDDDDCTSLGADHACEAGRCRAPREDMMSGGSGGSGGSGDGGTSDGDLPECTVDAVAEYLIGSDSYDGCHEDENEMPNPTARAQCVQNRIAANEPFAISWDEQGIDSQLKSGFIGVMDDADGFVVYELAYDSLGGWVTSWTPCSTFTVNEPCDALADCFACEGRGGQTCGCGHAGVSPLEIRCDSDFDESNE